MSKNEMKMTIICMHAKLSPRLISSSQINNRPSFSMNMHFAKGQTKLWDSYVRFFEPRTSKASFPSEGACAAQIAGEFQALKIYL